MQECLKVCILETESGMFVAGMCIYFFQEFKRNFIEFCEIISVRSPVLFWFTVC